MRKSKIFIASSSRTQTLAEVLGDELQTNYCEATLWSEDVRRRAGATNVEMLEAAAESYDFAVVILARDDVLAKEEANTRKARDNCVFEAGLFIRALGRDRCFLVTSPGTDMPTDLAGIIPIYFEEPEKLNDRIACSGKLKEGRVAGTIKDIVFSKRRLPSRPISDDELLERETMDRDGGYLIFPDQVVVVSGQPFELGYVPALQVWNNIKEGVSYVYLFKAEKDGANKVCGLLQMILLAPMLDAKEATNVFAQQAKMEDKDTQSKLVTALTWLCSKERLKVYFLRESPSLQYCIHNAQSDRKAVLYFKRVDGFIKWQEGPDAHNFWTEERKRHGIETIDQGERVTVSSRELVDFLRVLPDGASVSLTRQDNRLRVKSGVSQVDLSTLPVPMSETAVFHGASGFDVKDDPFNSQLKEAMRNAFPVIHGKVTELCFDGTRG